jgi:hypothetical protein
MEIDSLIIFLNFMIYFIFYFYKLTYIYSSLQGLWEGKCKFLILQFIFTSIQMMIPSHVKCSDYSIWINMEKKN